MEQNKNYMKKKEEYEKRMKDIAQRAARLLEDHKAVQTSLIDVSKVNTWTDYFIISTVMSSGHLRGLVRQLKDFFAGEDVEIFHKHKQLDGNGWELLDCGGIVIHLMSEEKREFYDLDKLWFNGEKVSLVQA